jgi:cobalt/nickel transport system permease protein
LVILLKYPFKLSITKEGVDFVLKFFLRVSTIVSFVSLLFLTTKFQDILSSFYSFKLPKGFVFLMEMCYRYIFLLLKITEDIYVARKSRSLKTQSIKNEKKITSNSIFFIFKKSLIFSDEVYKAMLSRGYRGEIKKIK